MRSIGVRATASCLAIYAALSIAPVQAADLIWEVESPFRLFKPTASFESQEHAFKQVRGEPRAPCRTIWSGGSSAGSTIPTARTSPRPSACAATAGKHYQQSRLGWAAQTLPAVCYEGTAVRAAIR